MCFGAILISSPYEVSESSPHFSIEYSALFFPVLICRNPLCILDTNPLTDRCIVNISSLSELLFSILTVSLDEQKF